MTANDKSEIESLGGEGYILAKKMLVQEQTNNETNEDKSNYWATIVGAIERNLKSNLMRANNG